MTRTFPKFINNQDGSLMVIALLIMVTLALAGLLTTNDAVMEGRVGRNYAIHKQTMSAAEAAGKELIQAIASTFESESSGLETIAELDKKSWKPYDGLNTSFDFDVENWTGYRLKDSDVEGDPAYINSADAFAVLVYQGSSIMNPGITTEKAPVDYDYVIYSRAEHAGAGNSEAILMLAYKQWKI